MQHNSTGGRSVESSHRLQFSTFVVAGRMYGLEVTEVQEVVKALPMTPIPLAPDYVHGLINLRGQVVTAIGMRELFGLDSVSTENLMNVICSIDGSLISLLVDEIGDVIEVSAEDFEKTPPTLSIEVKRLVSGVYKVNHSLMSVLDINSLYDFLNHEQRGNVAA